MQARRWVPVLLLLAACNGDDDVVTSSGRCAELVDLVVRSEAGSRPFPPILTNTAGDERLELWFLDPQSSGHALSFVGYEPGADGAYAERWRMTLSGNLMESQVDLTGDGYADFIVSPDLPTAGLYHHPAQSDGTVSAGPVAIPLLAGESIREWRDVDQDGRVDRVSRVNDDYAWISGASGEAHAFGIPLPEDDSLWALAGDSRLWAMRGADPDVSVMGRVEDSGFRAIWEGRSMLRGSGLHGDHFDVFERRPDGSEGPGELWMVRIDPSGMVLDEQMLAADTRGSLIMDYDGDGERDLVTSRAEGEFFISFGSAEHEYTEPLPLPAFTHDDVGIKQSFDLDRDGRTELLMAFEEDDGQFRWSALGWGPCDQTDEE